MNNHILLVQHLRVGEDELNNYGSPQLLLETTFSINNTTNTSTNTNTNVTSNAIFISNTESFMSHTNNQISSNINCHINLNKERLFSQELSIIVGDNSLVEGTLLYQKKQPWLQRWGKELIYPKQYSVICGPPVLNLLVALRRESNRSTLNVISAKLLPRNRTSS